MKRILLLIIRLIVFIPHWLITIHRYHKNIETVSFEERYGFIKNLVHKVNQKARVNIHCYGIENLPLDDNYLLTPNHQGLFDALILI